MVNKRFTASKTVHPQRADDLKLIHGIGPAIEKHLHAEGLRTFTQIEKLSAEVIAGFVPNVSANQIHRQGWIRQARRFATEKAGKGSRKKVAAASTSRQHYENFTFEFLLDEKYKIHRIRMIHVQSGDMDTWTEWNPDRLITFLAWHTGARLPNLQPAMSAHPDKTHITPSIPPFIQPPEGVKSSESKPQEQFLKAGNPQNITYRQEAFPPAPIQPLSQLHLLEWKTWLSNTDQPISTLPHGQAFDVGLTLDLSNVPLAGESQLYFTIKLYAKRMGNGCRELVNETQSTVPNSNIVNLAVRDIALPQGLYRLETIVTLTLNRGNSLDSAFRGGLLQVY
jgi:hypothetical protein